MAQVALAWLVDRPAVTSVILGARTVDQLDDNLAAAGLHLCRRGDREAHGRASTPGTGGLPVRRRRASQQRGRKLEGGW